MAMSGHPQPTAVLFLVSTWSELWVWWPQWRPWAPWGGAKHRDRWRSPPSALVRAPASGLNDATLTDSLKESGESASSVYSLKHNQDQHEIPPRRNICIDLLYTVVTMWYPKETKSLPSLRGCWWAWLHWTLAHCPLLCSLWREYYFLQMAQGRSLPSFCKTHALPGCILSVAKAHCKVPLYSRIRVCHLDECPGYSSGHTHKYTLSSRASSCYRITENSLSLKRVMEQPSYNSQKVSW